MRSTRHQPLVLVLGFGAGLLVSTTACAIITRAAPAVSQAGPENIAAPQAPARAAVRTAIRAANRAAHRAADRAVDRMADRVVDRDPFTPVVDIASLR